MKQDVLKKMYKDFMEKELKYELRTMNILLALRNKTKSKEFIPESYETVYHISEIVFEYDRKTGKEIIDVYVDSWYIGECFDCVFKEGIYNIPFRSFEDIEKIYKEFVRESYDDCDEINIFWDGKLL